MTEPRGMLLLAIGTFWAVALFAVAMGLARAASHGDHELVAAGVMYAKPAAADRTVDPADRAERHLRAA